MQKFICWFFSDRSIVVIFSDLHWKLSNNFLLFESSHIFKKLSSKKFTCRNSIIILFGKLSIQLNTVKKIPTLNKNNVTTEHSFSSVNQYKNHRPGSYLHILKFRNLISTPNPHSSYNSVYINISDIMSVQFC